MAYRVQTITAKQRDSITARINFSKLIERKAEIHGTCIKLFCDSAQIAQMWENNFHAMSENIRPHARLFCTSDRSGRLSVKYEPNSNTAFVANCDYYGWIKSIALALASDYLWDSPSLENRRYPIHGSLVDFGGRAIAIIGPPKSGKTTLTYGLLTHKKFRFLTDDWFFVRFAGKKIQTFSAEKNSYAGEDIAENWPALMGKVAGMRADRHGRSIVDVVRLFGRGRVRRQSGLAAVVLLRRERGKSVWQKLGAKEAATWIVAHDFCNPHQLTRNRVREKEQTEFFANLFKRVPVYLLNTIETPKESLANLLELAGAKDGQKRA